MLNLIIFNINTAIPFTLRYAFLISPSTVMIVRIRLCHIIVTVIVVQAPSFYFELRLKDLTLYSEIDQSISLVFFAETLSFITYSLRGSY